MASAPWQCSVTPLVKVPRMEGRPAVWWLPWQSSTPDGLRAISEVLETVLMYDQLNIRDVAYIENWRIQLVEERYGWRLREAHSGARSKDGSLDERVLFLGEEKRGVCSPCLSSSPGQHLARRFAE